jgi:hypothetical protein
MTFASSDLFRARRIVALSYMGSHKEVATVGGSPFFGPFLLS